MTKKQGILTMDNTDYLKKYNRCIYEYTNAAGAFEVSEDDNDDMAMAGPADGPGSQMDAGGEGGDPGMGGGMPGAPGAGAEGGMGSPSDSMGGDANGAGAQMDGSSAPQGVDGFDPQTQDGNAEGMEGMGGENTGDKSASSDEEVIDVDDLTKSQEKAEEKIDRMNDKFEDLMKAMNVLIKQNAERDAKEKEMAERIAAEIDRRIPTPQQKMTMRSLKSAPYNMTPDEYMKNYAPENYSGEDDRNGENDPQYKITKGDVDRFTDYASIARDLDIAHQGLNDILNFRG